jgi:hypothetical protein
MTEPHAASHPAGDTEHVPDPHGGSGAVEGAHGSTADHGDEHGHDDHAHDSMELGPVDWPMWGAGALGVAAGLVVAAAFAVATTFRFDA